MPQQLLTHGGQLLTHGGQLLWWIPSAKPMLHGHGGLSATAKSLRVSGLPTGHGLLTTAAMPKPKVTVLAQGHGALTATTSQKSPAALPGHGALTATAFAAEFNESGRLTGHGVLVATTKPKLGAALPGHGALTAAIRVKLLAALPGHGALSAAAAATKFSFSAALPGRGALTAAAFAKVPAIAAPHGAGALSAVARATKFVLNGTAAGHGVLAAAAFARIPVTGSASGHGTLAATTRAKIPVTAAAAGHGALTAVAAATRFTLSASATGHGALSAVAKATKFVLPGATAGHGALSATARQIAFVTANLSGNGTVNAPVYGIGFAVWSSTGNGTVDRTSSSPSWSHPANSNDYVIVEVFSQPQPTSVTYGGVGMTNLGSATASSGFGFLTFYGLAAVSGSATVSVNFGGPPTACAANSFSFINVGAAGGTQTQGISNQTATTTSFMTQGPLTCPTDGSIVQAFASICTTGYSGLLYSGGPSLWSGDSIQSGGQSWTLQAGDSTASTTFTGRANGTATGYNWCCFALTLTPVLVPRQPKVFGQGALTASAACTVFPALSGHGVLSGRALKGAPAALPGHGSLSAKVVPKIAATLHGNGALTTAVFAKIVAAAALPGHGSLTAVARATKFLLTGPATGHGVLTAKVVPKLAAALPGHGVLTAVTKQICPVTAAVSGHGVLTAAARMYSIQESAALPGHGTLTAAAYNPWPTYDATGAGNSGSTASGLLQVSETHVLSTAATAILIGVTATGVYTSLTTHTVTVGGVSATLLGQMYCNNVTSSADGWVELWGLTGPTLPTGSQTVTVSENSGGAAALIVNSVSYVGTVGFGPTVTNFGSSTALTTGTIASATNDMVAGIIGEFATDTISAPSGTQRWWIHPAGTWVNSVFEDAAGSNAGVALTATGSISEPWATVAINMNGNLASAAPHGQGVLTATTKAIAKASAALPGHGALTATTKKVVTFDTVGPGNVSSATPATLAESAPHVISAGANCIIVAVGCWAGQTATVKVGTTAMTAIGGLVNDNNASANGGVQLYQLLNSGLTGSQTITATWAGTKPTYAQINSLSFFNVTTVGAVQSTFGASSSLTQTVTSATSGMIAQAFTAYAAFGSTGITAYNKTQDYNPAGLGSLFCICLGHTAGAASVTFTATMAGPPNYAGIAVSLT